MAHVQLAQGGFPLRPVGPAVDHGAAHAADAFPAVVVEGDGLLALQGEPLVDNVQHLQEGGVRGNIISLVGFQAARGLRPRLPPDLQGEIDRLAAHL